MNRNFKKRKTPIVTPGPKAKPSTSKPVGLVKYTNVIESQPTCKQEIFKFEMIDKLYSVGNIELLKTEPIALFCSIKCPGDKILQTYDQCLKWRKEGQSVISGFHSPMEKECLRILLKGIQPVIISPARGIWKRIPREWKPHIDAERLLIVSKFPSSIIRMTAQYAMERNKFILTLASEIYVAHAAENGKTKLIMEEVL